MRKSEPLSLPIHPIHTHKAGFERSRPYVLLYVLCGSAEGDDLLSFTAARTSGGRSAQKSSGGGAVKESGSPVMGCRKLRRKE